MQKKNGDMANRGLAAISRGGVGEFGALALPTSANILSV